MRSLLIFAFGSLAMACASTPNAVGTTTTTSSDVPAPESREARSEVTGEAMPGKLVCRASSIHEGEIELYLEWTNGGGAGVLRRKAPSGVVTEQKLQAERVKGAIVADDVHSQDLVTHAAMVKEHKGRKYIRLGDWKQGWTPCE